MSGSTGKQYETMRKLVANYEFVTFELTTEKKDQNPALSMYEIPPSVVSAMSDKTYEGPVFYKCTSTSKTFMHNGNIDKQILIVLDNIGVIGLEDLSEGLIARAKKGRKKPIPKALRMDSNTGVTLEDLALRWEVELEKKVKSGDTMRCAGFRVFFKWGEYECMALIRRYKSDCAVPVWNVPCWLEKGHPAGDNEDLDIKT